MISLRILFVCGKCYPWDITPGVVVKGFLFREPGTNPPTFRYILYRRPNDRHGQAITENKSFLRFRKYSERALVCVGNANSIGSVTSSNSKDSSLTEKLSYSSFSDTSRVLQKIRRLFVVLATVRYFSFICSGEIVSPTSSLISLAAPSSHVSPTSRYPPGKANSPFCGWMPLRITTIPEPTTGIIDTVHGKGLIKLICLQ